jgi:hypothetical protein
MKVTLGMRPGPGTEGDRAVFRRRYAPAYGLATVGLLWLVAAPTRGNAQQAVPPEATQPQAADSAKQAQAPSLETRLWELPLALTGTDSGRALGAAWSRVDLAMRHTLVNESPSLSRIVVPARYSERFLGYLEGRLEVALPGAWCECVKHAEMLRNGHVRFATLEHSVWNDLARRRVDGPRSMPLVGVVEAEDSITLHLGVGDYPTAGSDGSMTLPTWLVKKVRESQVGDVVPISSVLFDGRGQALVAVTSTELPGGEIYCLSKSNGSKLWSKPMIEYAGHSYKGVGNWFTEMRLKGGVLILFHCSDAAIGIEGLDMDGNRLFQFSSSQQFLIRAP